MITFDPTLIVLSFAVSFAAVLALIPLAKKVGLTAKPNARKKHLGEIPMVGGLAVYCSVVLFGPNDPAFITAATLLLATGVIDDFKDIGFRVRLIVEMVAGLIMVKWGGIEVSGLGDLFGFGNIELGAFSTVFTVFAVVGAINAFNMIDGIDGLAGSLSLIFFLILMVLASVFGAPSILNYCYVFVGGLLAFLYFNMRVFGRKNAAIFLGDNGSMMLGFAISWLVISASQGDSGFIMPVTALWLIAVPLLDTVSIMVRRIARGKSPFAPDREHFHHILPVAGYSINQTVAIICLFAVTLSVVGIIGDFLPFVPGWVMFYLFLSQFAVFFWGMCHSWKMMKVARFLRESHTDRRSGKDRRQGLVAYYQGPERRVYSDQRSGMDRRSGLDRRYQLEEKDKAKFKERSFVYSKLLRAEKESA